MQAALLAKEAKNLKSTSLSITLSDANAVAQHKLVTYLRKKFLKPEFNCNRDISTAIARLRTGHLKSMKIKTDAFRSYTVYEHYPTTQLSFEHLLNCPAITVVLTAAFQDLLYSDKIMDVLKTMLSIFGHIYFILHFCGNDNNTLKYSFFS